MKIKITVLMFLISIFNLTLKAQQLLTENFDYAPSTPLTANNWPQIGATATLPITVLTSGLSYSGYTLSNIGRSVRVDSTGQDVYRDLYNNTTSGNLYTAFMLNVSSATLTGDYFYAYLPQNSTSNYTGRLFLKAARVSGYYFIGISKGAVGVAETVTYSTDSFQTNTTSLVVLKYQFNTGTTPNDSVILYNFNGIIPSTEPNRSVAATIGGTTLDATALGRVALRQGTNTSAPRLFIDGIRVANTWADLFNATNNLIQPSVFTPSVFNTTTTTTNITWNKNTNYNDTFMTTLVFVKALSPINIGNPTLSDNAYTANSSFSSANSFYQNDGAAKCLYKGDGNTVAVTGFNPNTLYHVTVMVVRNADSLYASPASISFTTVSSAPNPISGLTFTNIAQNSATARWNKPTAYNNANHTIVVFAKPTSTINLGTPNTNPNLITADSNFAGNGSKLAIDTAAICIYKGDSTFVNISGLNPAVTYHVTAFAINNNDSSYSVRVSGSFLTNGLGPAPVLTPTFIALSNTSARIGWTKNTGYSNAGFTTLVYLKQTTAVTQGTPSNGITNEIPNDSFGLGSKYQNDSMAFCVLKSDTNFIVVNNLSSLTQYHALIYVVRDLDSVYSNSSIVSGTTKAPAPLNVDSVLFTGLTTSTARISWKKPTSYSNLTNTTLVFVKAVSAINQGTPSRNSAPIQPSTNFTSTFSTRYQNDTAAKCVFNADTNFVTITNINNFTTYHVLIYVVRIADSTYSVPGVIGSGSALPFVSASNYTISQINKVNTVTGVPDSNNVRANLKGIVYGINQRTTFQGGIQFLLKDNTGGITVSNNATLSYTPKEGDSISVTGLVSSTRGLLILTTLDSLSVLSTNKTINAPVTVVVLNEASENNLIQLNSVKFLTKPVGPNWIANQTYQILTPLNDTFAIRIYGTSILANTPLPVSDYFSVIGYGSQVSNNNAPYTFIGYQILPRSSSDIIPFIALTRFNFTSHTNSDIVEIKGDPTQVLNLKWTKSANDISIAPVTYNILLDTLAGNFRNPIASYISKNSGADSSVSLTYAQLRTLLNSLGFVNSQTATIKFRVTASSVPFTALSDTLFLFLTLGNGLSINNSNGNNLNVYPNPFTNNISIQMPSNTAKSVDVEIVDITGKIIYSENVLTNSLNEVIVNTNALTKGIYILKVLNDNQVFTKKIIKE